jgi:hypothetical protein
MTFSIDECHLREQVNQVGLVVVMVLVGSALADMTGVLGSSRRALRRPLAGSSCLRRTCNHLTAQLVRRPAGPRLRERLPGFREVTATREMMPGLGDSLIVQSGVQYQYRRLFSRSFFRVFEPEFAGRGWPAGPKPIPSAVYVTVQIKKGGIAMVYFLYQAVPCRRAAF